MNKKYILVLSVLVFSFLCKGSMVFGASVNSSKMDTSNISKSVYLIGGISTDPKDENKMFTFEGVGITIGADKANGGPFFITYVIKDSPGMKAGLKENDQITAINGNPFSEQTGVADVTALLKGTSGTHLTVTVLRQGVSMNIDVTRGAIALPLLPGWSGKGLVPKNDVWQSSDMQHWNLISQDDNQKWSSSNDILAHSTRNVITNGSKIFYFGRKINIDPTYFSASDIMGAWMSSNGKQWKKILDKMPWDIQKSDPKHNTIHQEFSLYTLKGKIYAMVASYGTTLNKEVWTSVNGIDWKKNAIAKTFPYIAQENTPTEFNNKLWMFNYGQNGMELLSSSDGFFWNKVDSKISDLFSKKSPSINTMVTYKKYLYIFSSSYDGNILIYRSLNGKDWEEVQNALPKANADTKKNVGVLNDVISLNGKLWLIKSSMGTPVSKDVLIQINNELWSSADGVHWVLEATPDIFKNRINGNLIVQ